jgi:L-cysteine/cystine lyase
LLPVAEIGILSESDGLRDVDRSTPSGLRADGGSTDRKALARSAFPVTQARAYFNTGSMGPVSTVYRDTLAELTQHDVAEGRAVGSRYAALADATEGLRRELGALLVCEPSSVYLTQSTGHGLSTIIESFPWQPGDEVISTNIEHEACAIPLRRQAHRRGLVLRLADVHGHAATDNLDWIARLVTPRTRLIAVSAVAFETGWRVPVERIVAFARDAGLATLIDAAQAAGAVPLRLTELGVDYCALPMQKWLCGPEGVGALYVRPECTEFLTDTPQDRLVQGYGILAASAAHLKWLRERLGWEWIFERTAELAAYTRDAVSQSDFASLMTPAAHAGLTTITFDGADSTEALCTLEARGFVVRHLPALTAFRIATAFYNQKSEIDALLRAFSEVYSREHSTRSR